MFLLQVGKKVMEIQNAALGEHKLRDLNDEINKLIREKGHWETRIVELGGPNYAKSVPKEGSELEGASGKGAGYRCERSLLRFSHDIGGDTMLNVYSGCMQVNPHIPLLDRNFFRGQCMCVP